VGGAAQTKIVKKLGGGVRLSLAQYRELAAFAQFASDLDETTRAQLQRGQKVTQLMIQPQYRPLSIADQGMSLFAVSEGYLDDLPLDQVGRFEQELLSQFASEQKELRDSVNESGNWDKDIEAKFKAFLDAFAANFVA